MIMFQEWYNIKSNQRYFLTTAFIFNVLQPLNIFNTSRHGPLGHPTSIEFLAS